MPSSRLRWRPAREGDEPVYVQTMVGKGKPGPVGYADDSIYRHEVERTKITV